MTFVQLEVLSGLVKSGQHAHMYIAQHQIIADCLGNFLMLSFLLTSQCNALLPMAVCKIRSGLVHSCTLMGGMSATAAKVQQVGLHLSGTHSPLQDVQSASR